MRNKLPSYVVCRCSHLDLARVPTTYAGLIMNTLVKAEIFVKQVSMNSRRNTTVLSTAGLRNKNAAELHVLLSMQVHHVLPKKETKQCGDHLRPVMDRQGIKLRNPD